MRVAILVPTTAGPRYVTALVARPKLPTSLVITADDYRPLEEISARYDALVGPAGPLRSALGLSDGSFELRLDQAIESGRSWELPVALAHALFARGAAITMTAPDLVVWATGALDPDLRVKPDDYHVADKLALSRAMLAEFTAAGVWIALLLPPGADGRFAGPGDFVLPGNAAVHSVTSLAAAIGAVAENPANPSAAGRLPVLAGPEPRKRSGAERAWPLLWAMVFAVVLAAAVGTLLIWRPFAPGPTVPSGPGPQQGADSGQNAANAVDGGAAPAASGDETANPAVDNGAPHDPTQDMAALLPGLEIVARRDPAKRGCIAYLFKGRATVDSIAERAGNRFSLGPRRQLCAIVLRGVDDDTEVALDENLTGFVMASERRVVVRFMPGAEVELPLVQGADGMIAIVLEAIDAVDQPRYRLRLAAEEGR